MSKKVLFTGCSLTAGNGWVDLPPSDSIRVENKDSPELWVNLCYNKIDCLKNLELLNLGQSGASNTEIFETTVDTITKFGDNIDYLFCQWTSMPRYNFNAGFELWSTKESIHGCKKSQDIDLVDISWPRTYVNDLLDRIKVLHHLHWEIIKVVRYTNIINNLASKYKIKNVFFINGHCPWDRDYFVELHNVLPNDYTKFTKEEILNIDHRSDEDIYKLYSLAHKHYQEAGSVNQTQWINLYDSFMASKIDDNFDLLHPGIKSNKIYYSMVSQSLKKIT